MKLFEQTGIAYYKAKMIDDQADVVFVSDLEKYLESCPVVYGWTDSNTWSGRHTDNTHCARLAFIEPIEKACDHRVRLNSFSWMDSQTREINCKVEMTSHCEKCGKQLVATWRAK